MDRVGRRSRFVARFDMLVPVPCRQSRYLVLNRSVTIEVNGVPVQGEVLQDRSSAIVTRRDSGRAHSYRLSYAGDVDMTGNMGFVADCHKWVSPRLPLLLETTEYPPCKVLPGNGGKPWGWSLIWKGSFEQFVTGDGEVIAINAAC